MSLIVAEPRFGFADDVFLRRCQLVDEAEWSEAMRALRAALLAGSATREFVSGYAHAAAAEARVLAAASWAVSATSSHVVFRAGPDSDRTELFAAAPRANVLAWDRERRCGAVALSDAAPAAAIARGVGAVVAAETAALLEAHQPTVTGDAGGFVVRGALTPAEASTLKARCVARWNRDASSWSVPGSHAADLAELVGSWWRIGDAAVAGRLRDAALELDARRQAATATAGSVVVPGLAAGVALRLFQSAAVSYIAGQRRVLVADEVGLGKSLIALSAAAVTGQLPVLVLSQASLKLNWDAEVRAMFPGWSTTVVSGTARAEIEPADVIVCNFDIAWDRRDDLKAAGFSTLIVDESQLCKEAPAADPDGTTGAKKKQAGGSRRTAATLELANATPDAGLRLLLSATPMPNGRPIELFPQLQILGVADQFGGRTRFEDRWCDAKDKYGRRDVSGSSNEDELHELLIGRCMVRRRKIDVLPELPAVQVRPLVLPIDGKAAADYRHAEADIVGFLAQRAYELAKAEGGNPGLAAKIAAIRAEAAKHLVSMTTLRQLAAAAKAEAMYAWLDHFLAATDEKIVVFAHHDDVQQAIIGRYDCETILAASKQKPKAIQEAKHRFQTDPSRRIIVCSSEAASTGHTLTAASTVMVAELPFRPADLDQMIGRCWGRLNDLHGATLIPVVAADTIDARIWKLLAAKGDIVNAVIDGGKQQGRLDSVLPDVLQSYLELGRLSFAGSVDEDGGEPEDAEVVEQVKR